MASLRIPDTHTVDPGTYPARCIAVADKDSDLGPYRLWEFELEDGSVTTATSSTKLGPQSKAYGWLTALIGHKPKPGEDVDPVGKACRLEITIDEERGYNKVIAVLPPERPASPQPSLNLRPSGETLGYHPEPLVDEVPF